MCFVFLKRASSSQWRSVFFYCKTMRLSTCMFLFNIFTIINCKTIRSIYFRELISDVVPCHVLVRTVNAGLEHKRKTLMLELEEQSVCTRNLKLIGYIKPKNTIFNAQSSIKLYTSLYRGQGYGSLWPQSNLYRHIRVLTA